MPLSWGAAAPSGPPRTACGLPDGVPFISLVSDAMWWLMGEWEWPEKEASGTVR